MFWTIGVTVGNYVVFATIAIRRAIWLYCSLPCYAMIASLLKTEKVYYNISNFDL